MSTRAGATAARLQPWLSTAARWILAGVFAWAGWPKLLEPAATVRSVRNFALLPEAVVPAVGSGLPILELLLALALAAGVATRLAAVITAALMASFVLGIAAAWARGLSIECCCFGSSGTFVADPVPGYVRDIIRDVVYLGLAIGLARWPRSRLATDGVLGLDGVPGRAVSSRATRRRVAREVTAPSPTDGGTT